MTTFLAGEPKMYEAYNNNKDLYAIIAQAAFHNNYEDNLEFWPEGTELEIDGKKVIAGKKTHLNKAGKERRSTGKVLNLATCYGMSGRTAGIRLGYEGNEAKAKGEELLNSFFTDFKMVKIAIDNSKKFLAQNGYVEDFLGRRRRLEDINLDPYEAQLKFPQDTSAKFNPFLICGDRKSLDDPETIWDMILKGYVILSNAYHLAGNVDSPIDNEMSNQKFENLKKIAANPSYYYKEVADKDSKWDKRTNEQKLLEDMQALQRLLVERRYKYKRTDITFLPNEAFDKLIRSYQAQYGNNVPTKLPVEPMNLFAWTGRIAQASRQCFNARIQGSAASLTKLAMVDIFNDKVMNDCKAKLIIPVHDELLVECPEEYADIVEKRLPEIMINAAKRGGDDVPQSCDPYNVSRWYSDTAGAFMQEEFKKLEAKGLSREEALNKVIKNHTEVPVEAIMKTIETGCDLEF